MVLQQMLGVSGTDPCWAVAWKFPGLEAVTKLLDISLNVGRTGHVSAVYLEYASLFTGSEGYGQQHGSSKGYAMACCSKR